MTDTPPFSANGWSERDRLTRLETLQQNDAQNLRDLRKDISGLDTKLDLLLEQRSRRAGVIEAAGLIFKPAGTVVWGAILAFMLWAATAYLDIRGTR